MLTPSRCGALQLRAAVTEAGIQPRESEAVRQ